LFTPDSRIDAPDPVLRKKGHVTSKSSLADDAEYSRGGIADGVYELRYNSNANVTRMRVEGGTVQAPTTKLHFQDADFTKAVDDNSLTDAAINILFANADTDGSMCLYKTTETDDLNYGLSKDVLAIKNRTGSEVTDIEIERVQ